MLLAFGLVLALLGSGAVLPAGAAVWLLLAPPLACAGWLW